MVNTRSYRITENLLYIDGRNVLRIKLNIKKPATEEAKVFFLKKSVQYLHFMHLIYLASSIKACCKNTWISAFKGSTTFINT